MGINYCWNLSTVTLFIAARACVCVLPSRTFLCVGVLSRTCVGLIEHPSQCSCVCMRQYFFSSRRSCLCPCRSSHICDGEYLCLPRCVFAWVSSLAEQGWWNDYEIWVQQSRPWHFTSTSIPRSFSASACARAATHFVHPFFWQKTACVCAWAYRIVCV